MKLKEYLQELEEEAFELVAYCTTCKGAIEASYDHHLALTAALTHAQRHPEHQVIIGTEILGRAYAVSVEP